MLVALFGWEESQGIPVVLIEAKASIDEPLCMVDQFVHPCCLQPEFGQLTSLNGTLKISLHKVDKCLEVSDGSGRVAMSFELGKVAPVPSFGSFTI